jgi:ribonuclease BN (tRNA processing enzyme)
VAISHLHGDHFGGLPFLVLDGQFRRRTEDLTVLGPHGTAGRLEQAMETLFPGSSAVTRRFEVRVLEHAHGRPRAAGDLRITPYEVSHVAGAVAPRPGDPRASSGRRDLPAPRADPHLSPGALAMDLGDWDVAHDGRCFDL